MVQYKWALFLSVRILKSSLSSSLFQESKKNYCEEDDCKGKFCHPILKVCFKSKAIELVKMSNSKQRKVRQCSTSEDCKVGQFCPRIFKICVDKRKTYANTYRSVHKTLTKKPKKCVNDSDCPSKKYCHRHHEMCLTKVCLSLIQIWAGHSVISGGWVLKC